MKRWPVLAVFLVSLVCCPDWAGAEAGGSEFLVGVQTHFPQGKNRPTEKTVGMIKDLGADSLRDEVYWSMVERKRGEFTIPSELRIALQQAIDSGIKPLIILDYGNKLYQGVGEQTPFHGGLPVSDESQAAFADYAAFMARTFKGQVLHYEVWNEWNIGAGVQRLPPGVRPDPQAYVALLRKTYQALKAVDDNIIVIGGVVSGPDPAWIAELLERGAIEYMDALSIHPYSYRTPQPKPEMALGRVEDVHRLLQRYAAKDNFPVYITEIGWPSNVGPFGTRPETVGDYLARFFFLAKTKPYIRGVWWYDLQNDGSNIRQTEDNFGLVQLDFTPKPAYYALRDIASVLKETEFAGRIEGASYLWALRFAHPDGRTTLALWSDRGGSPTNVTIRFAGDTGEKVLVQEVGSGATGREQKLEPDNRQLSLPVSGRPWLVQGQIDRIELGAE